MGRFEAAAIENWEQSMYLSLFGNGQEKNCGQRRDEYRASQSSSAQHHEGSAEIQRNGVPVVPQQIERARTCAHATSMREKLQFHAHIVGNHLSHKESLKNNRDPTKKSSRFDKIFDNRTSAVPGRIEPYKCVRASRAYPTRCCQ